jgi:hypothetical protein
MKYSRSEYLANQSIIRGFNKRYIVPVPTGTVKTINLALWLVIGFILPFALIGIIQHLGA